MNRIAIFPGSFDPMTIGHKRLIENALPLFDKIIVAIEVNRDKKYTFPLEERTERIAKAFESNPAIEVVSYNGLTTDLCHQKGAKFILRGIRNISDFEYERTVADNNRILDPSIETICLFAEPTYATISSSMVRELHAFGVDVSSFMV